MGFAYFDSRSAVGAVFGMDATSSAIDHFYATIHRQATLNDLSSYADTFNIFPVDSVAGVLTFAGLGDLIGWSMGPKSPLPLE